MEQEFLLRTGPGKTVIQGSIPTPYRHACLKFTQRGCGYPFRRGPGGNSTMAGIC